MELNHKMETSSSQPSVESLVQCTSYTAVLSSPNSLEGGFLFIICSRVKSVAITLLSSGLYVRSLFVLAHST